MSTRIVIVDDHPLFRSAVRGLFEDAAVAVMGEYAGESEALAALADAEPDVMTVDISLQEGDGISLVRQIKQRHPAVRVLVLSMYADSEQILNAFRAGADGYIQKGAPPDQIKQAFQTVLAGQTYLDASLSPVLISQLVNNTPADEAPKDPYDQLTDREQEIFKLVADGFSSKEIAGILKISLKTVENHRSAVTRKMGFENIVEWVQKAIKLGVVVLDD